MVEIIKYYTIHKNGIVETSPYRVATSNFIVNIKYIPFRHIEISIKCDDEYMKEIGRLQLIKMLEHLNIELENGILYLEPRADFLKNVLTNLITFEF